MELTNALNNFVASWYFVGFMVLAVIGGGIYIRLKFKHGGKEYKYKSSSRRR